MGIILNLWVYLLIDLLLFIPAIMCVALVVIIIGVIKTKVINKKFKILIITVILLFITIISINIKDEKPNSLYTKMKKINDYELLIGLSEDVVVKLLGESKSEYNRENQKVYRYSAGSVGKGLFLGKKCIFFDCYYDYVLYVYFDENDNVKSTLMQPIP